MTNRTGMDVLGSVRRRWTEASTSMPVRLVFRQAALRYSSSSSSSSSSTSSSKSSSNSSSSSSKSSSSSSPSGESSSGETPLTFRFAPHSSQVSESPSSNSSSSTSSTASHSGQLTICFTLPLKLKGRAARRCTRPGALVHFIFTTASEERKLRRLRKSSGAIEIGGGERDQRFLQILTRFYHVLQMSCRQLQAPGIRQGMAIATAQSEQVRVRQRYHLFLLFFSLLVAILCPYDELHVHRIGVAD